MPEKKPALAGLKILDLSDAQASLCSRLLADTGAEVLKVEPPGGDPARRLGPFKDDSPDPEGSLSFRYRNLNKLGITLDLDNKAGRESLIALARDADVLVESYPPGYLAKRGLGYEALSRENPGLIFASVSGFGQTGPYRDYKSTDITAAAAGGQMSVCGTPNKPPLKTYGQQAYNLGSLFAVNGILLALHERRRSGCGQQIDISLQEAVAAALDHVLPRYHYIERGQAPGRLGSHHWNSAFGIVPCRDGNLLISPVFAQETLVELMAADGRSGDFGEEKWQRPDYLRQNMDTAMRQVGEWSRHHNTGELFEMGQLMRIPWAQVCAPSDIILSPQLEARKFFMPLEHPTSGDGIRYPGPPCRFGDTPPPARPAPRLGEHNNRLEEIRRKWAKSKPETTRSEKALPPGDILKGVRILDFSRVLAGPYATRILGDFGAEIIKVQTAGTNDGIENNNNGYFHTWNRNKRSITLNMNHPEARPLALQLMQKCDVVLENFTPRVMQNWGLEYQNLRELKPDIIMVSLSGMGQDGPWRDFAAFGFTIEALTGLTSLTAYDTDRPLGSGFAYADHVGGLVGAWATLTALEQRERTGQGQYIEISEYEAMCAMLGPALLAAADNDEPLLPAGNAAEYDASAFNGCYRCRGNDRWCVITLSSNAEWRTLANIIDASGELAARYTNAAARREKSAEIQEIINRWTRRHSPRQIMHRLQAAGITAAAVNNARDLHRDPQLKARGFFIKGRHPVLGRTQQDASPIRMSRNPARRPRNAPRLGEHNRYVYHQLLGLSQAEIARLVAAQVIH